MTNDDMTDRNLEKAALRGEPSYIWRAGQERRLGMILDAGGNRVRGAVLDDGCGVGTYVTHLTEYGGFVVGMEYEYDRAAEARKTSSHILSGAGERLPFPSDFFDLILSNEVIEHVENDRQSVAEMVRVLKPGGRIILFCPNVGYPFETHGIFLRGKYHFGNIPLVNYLPRPLRNKLAPHVRIYSGQELENLFAGLSVEIIRRDVIFGAYDNIIARFPRLGKTLRKVLYRIEKTPLRFLGLSHYWVIEKKPSGTA